jgi:hypothetical protein
LVENPYFQFFCGEEFFQHRLVFDRSSLTRWRQRMGEEKLQALRRRASRSPPRPRRSYVFCYHRLPSQYKIFDGT